MRNEEIPQADFELRLHFYAVVKTVPGWPIEAALIMRIC